MPSHREQFFELASFAVIGHTQLKPFPKLTYGNLKQRGKQVYPVDLAGSATIEGDTAFGSVADLPAPVEGAIVEVPTEAVLEAVQQVADAGIKQLWIHMGCDTPEALQLCAERGIDVRHGTCAVMYTQVGFSFHSLHKGIMKLVGKY